MSWNFAATIIYNVKGKPVPLPCEQREKWWINCQKYIIDLTSCSTYKHFSSMCKWYLLFVNNNFVEKQVSKIINWIYILLGNNHLGNIFAKVLTIKTLFALAKPSTIADCQGEFQGLGLFLYVNEQVPCWLLQGHPNFSNLEILVLEIYQNNRKWLFLGV